MSDHEILSLERVTPEMAGRYLGCSAQMIRFGLRGQRFPFGTAVKGGRWVYYISPPALVKYKNEGVTLERLNAEFE